MFIFRSFYDLSRSYPIGSQFNFVASFLPSAVALYSSIHLSSKAVGLTTCIIAFITLTFIILIDVEIFALQFCNLKLTLYYLENLAFCFLNNFFKSKSFIFILPVEIIHFQHTTKWIFFAYFDGGKFCCNCWKSINWSYQ